jgi:tetratricopeptide (TPR) repeat protein
MKKLILMISVAVLALAGSSTLSAQGKFGPDSAECIKYLSYYTEYYKQKNYDSAIPNWRQAYKLCPPSSRYTMLSNGTTLVKRLIQQNSKNPIYREALIDTLMTIYDQRVEFWPKYATSSLNNKALDIYNFMKKEPVKMYEGLTEVISINKEQTTPNVFLFQVNTAIDLYKDGLMDAEVVINAYETATQYLAAAQPKNDTEKATIEKTVGDIENLFISSQVASCDNLIALFTPRYDADPQNLDLAKNIVKMMLVTEGCTDNDLFLNAVTTMYNLEPSHNSAYNLYKLYSSRGDFDNALKYMEEAIAAEDSDAETDAGYNFELAAF